MLRSVTIGQMGSNFMRQRGRVHKSPNDPKLSDSGAGRGSCRGEGAKAAAEAATVTGVAVRSSAVLGLIGELETGVQYSFISVGGAGGEVPQGVPVDAARGWASAKNVGSNPRGLRPHAHL